MRIPPEVVERELREVWGDEAIDDYIGFLGRYADAEISFHQVGVDKSEKSRREMVASVYKLRRLIGMRDFHDTTFHSFIPKLPEKYRDIRPITSVKGLRIKLSHPRPDKLVHAVWVDSLTETEPDIPEWLRYEE